jgi:hypothetical protein
MDKSLSVLLVLIGTALPAVAQNSTSPGNQAAANSTQQQAASAADQTARLLLANNSQVDPAARDAVLGTTTAPAPRASRDLTGKLAEGAPKYQPPASVEPGTDLRTIDKPKNQIPRLPVEMMQKYVVKDSKVPALQGRDLYTTKELVSMEYKAHPGLRLGNVFGLNDGYAYQMFLEDERQAKMDDLKDTAAAFAVGGDPAEARAVLDLIGQAYIWNEPSGGPVGIK